jgi:FtsP/CotA-like multicopper oxidase with cupredoxin domain
MSVQNPAHKIARWSVVGMEGMWAKMFDPPVESPATPDQVAPTNPVPEVVAAAGLQNTPTVPHTVQRNLLHGLTLPTWDGLKQLKFYTFQDKDNPATGMGTYPAGTIRVPRGVVYHAETSGEGPPPHTIHWHGIEPTPMNDGVGHCSMELGQYVYQWQPNFIGTYFYHCHRNTMQHFEFGLFGLLLIEPPDAYFATQVDPNIPIGHCRDGKRRTAANLAAVNALLPSNQKFPDFNGNLLTDPDPWTGDPALKFATDPHAMTVAYDVEALWVLDDRDSVWSDMAPDARATFPRSGSIPGINDEFNRNPGKNGFFAFNDFNADYWYVTGVPVPAHKGGTGTIPANAAIPAALNSGVDGTQVAVNAQTGQTILIRCLDAAYNSIEVTFPVDIVIIAWDGRALGQPPYGHNEAYVVPANTPIHTSTARRFDALIRTTQAMNDFVTVKFINTRGQVPGLPEDVLVTTKIPFNVGGSPVLPTFAVSGKVAGPGGAPLQGVALDVTPVSLGGSSPRTVLSDANGNYSAPGLTSAAYMITPSLSGFVFTPDMVTVAVNDKDLPGQNFTASADVGGIILTPDKVSPQAPDVPGGVTFNASVNGGGPYEFRFRLISGSVTTTVQDFSLTGSWHWISAGAAPGVYRVEVDVRVAGATSSLAEKSTSIHYLLTAQEYTLDEAIETLRMATGSKVPTSAELARLDVAPLLNGVTTPDGKVDIQDVIAILRKVVGLPL